MKKIIKNLSDGGLAEDTYAFMKQALDEDEYVNKEKMEILDKVEEFLEGCMFNEESNNEIWVIKYKTVSELINAMRAFVK